ncbi:MAG: transcription elongation factor GreA [Fimbriimonadaceae bacterium]|nr:transcription elongation factor GreA [Fimbriimonadaceae bacterium]QYK58848.1 MAG: transcription elongation factor GreA [Fimbriimonadaceae bacterium]
MAHEVMLSPEGYDRLKKELDHLKSVERQRVAENIREAKSHGDLRENAMYHEAKLNQKRLEGRIADLEKVLQTAKIVEKGSLGGDIAHLGSKVTVKDLDWGDELSFTLVGAFEADPANDLISITSPLGEALIGKTADDEVEVEAPAGKQKYRILSVEPGEA